MTHVNQIEILDQNLRNISRPNRLPALLNVGLTGSIGSGKSTLAAQLQGAGALMIDFDAISHQLTGANGAAMPEIVAAFGAAMQLPDGALHRSNMRQLVFHDGDAKRLLEKIMHRLISQHAILQAAQLVDAQPNALCVVYDIPLLYGNTRWLDLLDAIVCVTCERTTQISRVLQRSPQLTVQMVERILAQQANNHELRSIANVVFDNTQNAANHLQNKGSLNILLRYITRLTQAKEHENY
jgi:dephospho-CoA kinase